MKQEPDELHEVLDDEGRIIGAWIVAGGCRYWGSWVCAHGHQRGWCHERGCEAEKGRRK